MRRSRWPGGIETGSTRQSFSCIGDGEGESLPGGCAYSRLPWRRVAWSGARGLDNVLKPVIDAIRKAGRLWTTTGRYVTECSIRFGPLARAASILVSVEPVE